MDNQVRESVSLTPFISSVSEIKVTSKHKINKKSYYSRIIKKKNLYTTNNSLLFMKKFVFGIITLKSKMKRILSFKNINGV